MHIAVEGCSHGELDRIYDTIRRCEIKQRIKVDLLICCGDFQSVRNIGDLRCMAVPTKYMSMQTFYKYYSGERRAPVLTIFIGGNHEASNYLQELPYGGWVAPNIYFLGNGGCVNVGGLRIGGVSGIYKGHDFLKGKHEFTPYTQGTVRSVYHVRNLEVFRVKQLSSTIDNPFDIFLSHDWPRGVTNFGDSVALCRKKHFFTQEVQSNTLGSRAAEEMLDALRPRHWFSGHLHVRFTASVQHQRRHNGDDNKLPVTEFLALDKCLGNRRFLEVIECQPNPSHLMHDASGKPIKIRLNGMQDVDVYNEEGNVNLYHDLEWLTILRLTNHLSKTTSNAVYMPGPGGADERYNFTPSEQELRETLKLMDNDLLIKPEDFVETAPSFNPRTDSYHLRNMDIVPFPKAVFNPYTINLCDKLKLDDPVFMLINKGARKLKNFSSTPIRNPNKFEMNVTLDSSLNKSFNEKSMTENSINSSSSDIVFEVSINNDADGSSVGVLTSLSSEISSSQPQPAQPQSRKSLKLSAPVNISPIVSEEACSTEDTPLKCSASSLTTSPKRSLEEKCQKVQLSAPVNISPIVSEEPCSTEDTPLKCSASSPTTSPKRSLEEVSQKEAPDSIKKKPSKIRRRNAAVYTSSLDD